VPPELTLIGVPSSMGAFAPGQEKAPAALRKAGLTDLLRDGGVAVDDRGDSAVRRWRPDPERPYAQNLPAVIDVVRETAGRVREADGPVLVLGGDCTVGVGTVAGQPNGRVGLVYFDMHADLNVPGVTPVAALDWMGMAHVLHEEGAEPELTAAVPRLDPDLVVLFGYRADQFTHRELDAVDGLGLEGITLDEVAADPAATAARALELIEPRCERLLIHFDVDVIDFTDAPLSEARDRNIGLPLDTALEALRVLARSERLAGVTVTELNPDHGEPDGSTVRRFAEGIASALSVS
jgi:arginase